MGFLKIRCEGKGFIEGGEEGGEEGVVEEVRGGDLGFWTLPYRMVYSPCFQFCFLQVVGFLSSHYLWSSSAGFGNQSMRLNITRFVRCLTFI